MKIYNKKIMQSNMLDLNKYLQDQLTLAQRRVQSKLKNTKKGVSEESAVAAEIISQKQNKVKKKKKSHNSDLKKVKISKVTASTAKASDDDSEYFPSCDEDDDNDIDPLRVLKNHTKHNFKKIIDDGDNNFYIHRLEKWKSDLKHACLHTFDGSITSADVQYALTENTNVNDMHELKNGLKIPLYIWKQLYSYQRTGVKWLWELHQVKSGGLLGDEMGLGKTVQVIAFLAALTKSEIGSWSGLGPSVIVAPATVLYQWVSHFHYWCPYMRVAVLHHSGSHVGNHERLIRDINKAHGILLISYAGIVKYNKALTGWQWHYCILDEGHKIRNPDTHVSKMLRKFPTVHRLLITGTPMQNNLMELWSLYDFIRPGLLGTQNAFLEHFALPITQGGYANATEFQETTALHIAKALKDMITPYLLRRTKAELQEHIKLPEKNEQVLFCALSVEQRDLYMGYLMSGTVRGILDKESRYGDPLRTRILIGLSTLRKICNHPDLYLYEAQEIPAVIDEKHFGHWKRSGKMSVVHSLLKIWQKQGHRVLMFTQSRAMICILEQYLQQHSFKYLRMDGTVSVSQRQSLIKTYNENTDYLVFLATTRVGGIGVNLTGADRVIIYDPDWNPATDTQAKERAWRIGQKRNVTVYRLISAGTIEEKIYQRQVFKHLLSNKVFLDPNQKNIFTTSTLQGLFTLEEPNREGDTETSTLFKNSKVAIQQNYKSGKRQECDTSHQTKLEAMRKRAKEISKRITEKSIAKATTNEEDPREKYKKKRDALLNPPKIEEPALNLLDEEVTSIPFSNILSEIDIISMHTKKNYEENLIKNILTNHEEESEILENECDHNSVETIQEDNVEQLAVNIVDNHNLIINKKHSGKRKISDTKIENLVGIKKLKDKKHKKEKLSKTNDDDYVLNKLFSKSTLKNALQHDEIVGLSEKEKRYRMEKEASRKARNAMRALKSSLK